MAHPGSEFLNHIAQWVVIGGGMLGVWTTLYRMRKNHMETLRSDVLKELTRVEEDLKGDVREVKKLIVKVGDTVTVTSIKVAAIEAIIERCPTCQSRGGH